jgi:hypothetical protein
VTLTTTVGLFTATEIESLHTVVDDDYLRGLLAARAAVLAADTYAGMVGFHDGHALVTLETRNHLEAIDDLIRRHTDTPAPQHIHAPDTGRWAGCRACSLNLPEGA